MLGYVYGRKQGCSYNPTDNNRSTTKYAAVTHFSLRQLILLGLCIRPKKIPVLPVAGW